MRIFVDESGDFGFPEDRFDAYAIAAITVPESEAERVDSEVDRLKTQLGVSELHARELEDAELQEVCRALAALPIGAACTLTDTTLIPPAEILQWRLDQAGELAKAWERSEAKASGDAAYREEYEKLLGWIGHESRISNNEFIEFGALMPQVVADGVQGALFHYRRLEWGPDLDRFEFIFDAKLAGRASKAERYLERTLPGIMHSDGRFGLTSPIEWRDHPEHPFLKTFLRGDGFVDLRKILVGTMRGEDSVDYAGLQIADVVAHSLRRAAIAAAGSAAAAGWQELKPVVIPVEVRPGVASVVRFFAIRNYFASDLARYQHLH